jgi:hypothetical protein
VSKLTYWLLILSVSCSFLFCLQIFVLCPAHNQSHTNLVSICRSASKTKRETKKKEPPLKKTRKAKEKTGATLDDEHIEDAALLQQDEGVKFSAVRTPKTVLQFLGVLVFVCTHKCVCR